MLDASNGVSGKASGMRYTQDYFGALILASPPAAARLPVQMPPFPNRQQCYC
jgi:hypothetical protein